MATTVTVVLCTILGLPVSTTHCQVGAIVFVGLVSLGSKRVAWPLFGRIGLSWLLTLPLSAGLAAALLGMLRPSARQ